MKSIFEMQGEFLKAGDVKFPDGSVDAKLLANALISEEYNEYIDEDDFNLGKKETWNELKEVCDLIIVCAQKLNIDVGSEKAQLLFEAVMKNNMDKCVDGKLVKREDGKILKREGFDKMGWMVDFEKILGGES